MKVLHLYSAEECHLCDMANDILLTANNKLENKFAVEYINVMADKGLMIKYGTKIPVLELKAELKTELKQTSVSGKRTILFWPFNEQEILEMLDSC